jgi:acetoin utilization protein AcuB
MKKIPPMKSVMTPSPLSVAIDAPIGVAEDMMIDHGIRHLPVTESENLVGLVSDRDIAFTSNSPEADLRDRIRIRDVCSLSVYAIEVDQPLDLALREMADRRIGSAVVTEKGKVVGVFTATDACRCFADFLESQFPRAKDDTSG